MKSIFKKSNFAYLFFLASVIIVLSLFLVRYIVMLDTTKTCGIVTGEYTIKGHRRFEIVYKVEGVTKKAIVNSQSFKLKNLDSLKKIDCIEIEYSNILPTSIRVIDTKIGSGKVW